MKLTYWMFLLFLVSVAQPATAARDAGFERATVIKACELTDLQHAILNQEWNKLSMRFFMASMEHAGSPHRIQNVRAEVDQALAELRDEYGSDCVLEIL